LGAVDLDPWIPKPSTRDIVDHLVQEINAAKQIAQEITSVQTLLDGMLEGATGEGGTSQVMEKVTRELEEKRRKVEELEGILGVEREEKRVLEERIRVMEDERAGLLQRQLELEDTRKEVQEKEEVVVEEEAVEEEEVETLVNKDEQPPQPSPIPLLAIPSVIIDIPLPVPPTPTPTTAVDTLESHITPPTSPSTAPSSPLHDTRSISPISLPSTDSSHTPDPTPALLEKISLLEQQLQHAHSQIATLKDQLHGTSPVLGAVSSALEFPFTFSAPSPGNSLRGRNARSTNGSGRRKRGEKAVGAVGGGEVGRGGEGSKELFEGLVAAVGIVVIGWMGTWFVNQLVERGRRTAA
jgi:hypothetical protein